ncbi:hypothetical protein ACOMHN_016671 [Nucella lapillus]
MDEELKTAKKTIRSLLISVKEGLTVRQLENDYIEFIGGAVNTPINKDKVVYVADLERENFSALEANKKSGNGQGYQGKQCGRGAASRKQTPAKTAVQDPYERYFAKQSQQPHCWPESYSPETYWDDDYDDLVADKQEENSNKPVIGIKLLSPEEECIINEGVQNKVKQILAKSPKGMWANRLPVMYKQMFKQDVPLKDYGHHSVIEFVLAMPHLVRIERPYEKGDWLLSDATEPRKEPEEPASKQQQITGQKAVGGAPLRFQPDESKVPFGSMADFKESVRQVLQHHSDGVMLANFPQVYEEMTGYRLDLQTLGHADIYSLLAFFAEEDVLTMNYDNKESTRLIGVCTSSIRRFDLLKEAYKPHPSHGVVVNQQGLPSGLVGRGRCYPPATMQDMHKLGNCEVHVSSVVSPSYFWVQKRSDIGRLDDLMDELDPGYFWVQKRSDIGRLDDLMDELEEEYSRKAGEYRMPRNMMVRGQVCAALFEDNNWHRAIITGSCHDGKVMVYYVDYGNSNPMDPATICFLTEKFLSLPVQALQSKLAFLLPPEGHPSFSSKAKDGMLQMVMERPLHALISDIENLVLTLVLVDTTGNEDFCINDQLVNMGLARFNPDEDQHTAERD